MGQVEVRSIQLFTGADLGFATLEAIVGKSVSDLQPEADASPVFASTVVLTCSSSALACTVVVITTGARKRPNTAQAALP